MYSAKFRERMVRKMMGPPERSASALSKEVGISQSTLSRWLRVSVPAVVNGDDVRENRLTGGDRSPWEKAELVIEASKLEGVDFGAFLRRNGLHEADLEQMKKWLGERLDTKQLTREEKKTTKKAQQANQK